MEFPNSIITQVATQQEHKSYSTTHIDKKSSNGSVKQKKRKDSSSSRQRSSGLHSLLCCLRPPSRRRRTPSDKKHHRRNNSDDDDDDDDNNRRDSNAPNNNNSQLSNEGNGGSEVGERSNMVAMNGGNGGGDMRYLLPPLQTEHEGKKCAVIDLDETLVHSSFKPISNADFIVPVEIDGTTHEVYVLKRPHVDTYLERMGEMFECVLFTASLAKYADPVADLLDKSGVFAWRLFRESCVFHHGNYVKDLNLIGRQLNKTIIIDNSPVSYSFHPNNAVPVISWFDDPHDTELLDILPFLEAIAESEDVYAVLTNHGFTSHAVRNTDFLKQHQQQQQLRDDDDDDDDNDVITSVRQDR